MGCVGEDGGGGYDDDGLIVMVQPARHSVHVHASRQPCHGSIDRKCTACSRAVAHVTGTVAPPVQSSL